jgi:hypothetical protein
MLRTGKLVVGVCTLAWMLAACAQPGTMRTQSLRAASEQMQSPHSNRSVYVDGTLARAVARTAGATRAYVLIGDTNAYVALDATNTAPPRTMMPRNRPMHDGEAVAPEVRKRIEVQVRQSAPHVRNVYVNTSRNAYEQLSLYGSRFSPNTDPSRALMEQFNQYVQNVFGTPSTMRK